MSLRADDPLVEILVRNEKYWAGQKVLIVGEINSLQLLSQLVRTEQATILSDNFETAQGLSAMMGVTLERGAFARAQKKHVTVLFGNCHDPQVLAAIEPFDTLVLFLSKTKSLSQDLLWQLRDRLAPETKVLIIGSNAIGGKSADSLIRDAGEVYKVDSARKSTVFLGYITLQDELKTPKTLKSVVYGGQEFKQLHGLFSQGELDGGTKMLLQALHHDLSTTYHAPEPADQDYEHAVLKDLPLSLGDPILDLGCGSGIIGLTLAARGCTNILSTDVSATALYATQENAQALGLTTAVTPFACNMLPSSKELQALSGDKANVFGSGKFKYIVTNPPFHQGIERTTSPTLDMIAKAKDHLTADGALYLVGNTSLHYEQTLQEAFTTVTTLAATTKFTVFKATL